GLVAHPERWIVILHRVLGFRLCRRTKEGTKWQALDAHLTIEERLRLGQRDIRGGPFHLSARQLEGNARCGAADRGRDAIRPGLLGRQLFLADRRLPAVALQRGNIVARLAFPAGGVVDGVLLLKAPADDALDLTAGHRDLAAPVAWTFVL